MRSSFGRDFQIRHARICMSSSQVLSAPSYISCSGQRIPSFWVAARTLVFLPALYLFRPRRVRPLILIPRRACCVTTISQIATVQTARSISSILLRPRRLRSGGDDGSTMTNVVSSFPVNLLPLCLAGPSIQGEALHCLMNLLSPPRCFV